MSSLGLPLTPMLARAIDTIPPGMAYEPKWDGWRCLLARDGDTTRLWSRHGTELTAQFPELVAAGADLPDGTVLDGEVVIIVDGKLDYTKLASRAGTATEHLPASLVVFDLLAIGDRSLLNQPWTTRHTLLETLAGDWQPPLLLSPHTLDHDLAVDWFHRFEGAGLDGVVAKPVNGTYQPGQRALYKIKHQRTAEVVVAGFRHDRNSTAERPSLGSIQLGLFDEGVLHWVGVCAGFPQRTRAELAVTFTELEVARGSAEWHEHPWSPQQAARTGARLPDGISRWSQPRDEVRLISPLLVCEVGYDHLHDRERFRSNTSFIRWRPDRAPESCTIDQLVPPEPFDIRRLAP